MGSLRRRTHGRERAVLKRSVTEGRGPDWISGRERYTLPVFLDKASARFLNRTGGYVSGRRKVPMIQSTPVKIAMTPSTQRHPFAWPRKPPTIGPSYKHTWSVARSEI